jgi:hypothetical protein
MVTTTPTIPAPQARRPLLPARPGNPQLTDAYPQAAPSSGPSCPAVRSRSYVGITTGWTRSTFARSLAISEGTVNTYLDTLHLQRLHPHHFPRSMK